MQDSGSPVRKVLAVLGPGTLGCSVARAAAERGLSVMLVGRTKAHAAAALDRLRSRWTCPPETLLQPVGPDDPELRQAAWLLECLPEDAGLKAKALNALDQTLPVTCQFLTGSSGLPVGFLSAQANLARPLIGFHPFVPVRNQRIVERVAPDNTPQGALETTEELAALLGLAIIPVRDQPGYAATRMGLIQGLEAMRLLEQGAASAEGLDRLMVHGYGHPCGPLELSDRIGLDVRLALAEHLWAATGETAFEPPGILRRLVAEGRLGRKTGQGFHTWPKAEEHP